MNLIYIGVFYQESYINLLHLLLLSIQEKSNINRETTHICIMTTKSFEQKVKNKLANIDLPIIYIYLDVNTLVEAACARLLIFNTTIINNYDKILYLDTDILVNSDINTLFDLEISSEKLYALEEGIIGHEFWGSMFFDFTKYYSLQPGFSSGILYFKNSDSIKSLFSTIWDHILVYLQDHDVPLCLDQPFIVYNTISKNMQDYELLRPYAEIDPKTVNPKRIVYHFAGGIGKYGPKMTRMTNFWEQMNSKIKICQYGTDGFGHQLEGMLRLISLSLNNKAEYIYDYRKQFFFEHSNFDKNQLQSYLIHALDTNSSTTKPFDKHNIKLIKLSETRSFQDIIKNDNEYINTLYCYDGVETGILLPNNFEHADELEKSLPILRKMFVLENPFLPKPSYHNNNSTNVVCHIRLNDAVGQRPLDNDLLINFVKQFQNKNDYKVTIHSDGDVEFLKSDNTTIYDKNTDVLQILSDFVNANIFIMNISSLSIAAHLLANENQIVYCPTVVCPAFYKRILNKCIKIHNLRSSKYSWKNEYIIFIENGEIEAFGKKGEYRKLDTYIVEATFCGAIHTIIFNNDYTEYTSIRKHDNEIVKGILL